MLTKKLDLLTSMRPTIQTTLPFARFLSDIKFISLSKSVAFERNFFYSFWLNHRVIHFTHAAINTTFFF